MYAAKMARRKHTVKLVEGKVLYDAKGRPIVQPPTLLGTFDVTAGSLDDAIRKAREKGQSISGGRLPAVSVSPNRSPNGHHVLIATVRAR
jgi:hypothetical protein